MTMKHLWNMAASRPAKSLWTDIRWRLCGVQATAPEERVQFQGHVQKNIFFLLFYPLGYIKK